MATIVGTNGRDVRHGTTADDLITLRGGDDKGWGGEGNDSLSGGTGQDSLCGGSGSDTLDGGAGDDRLWGGEGADKLVVGSGHDTVWGDAGDDLILVQGREGSPRVEAFVLAGDGDDVVKVQTSHGLHAQVLGGAGDDQLTAAGDGSTVRRSAKLSGGEGNDWISAYSYGGPGDRVEGNSGNDTILSNGLVHGGDGDDLIYATGADGTAQIHGDAGNDAIHGGEAAYHGYGGARLNGGSGDDLILGGGPDRVNGGSGDDVLMGGDIWGGSGTDTFYFRGAHPGPYDASYLSPAGTTIHDFGAGEAISLAWADVLGPGASYYSANPPLQRMTRELLEISRSGDDLLLSAPAHDGAGSMLVLAEFFSRGLTHVTVDGVSMDVSGV
jgi:Ca2+-binding RTX toxin-like protein